MAVNTLNSGGAKVGGHFVHAACVAAHVYLRVHVCLCVHARMLSGAGCGPCERRHVTRADYGTFRLAPRGDQSQLFFGADHLARLWLFLSCLARDSAGVVLFVSHASLSRTARCLAQLFVSQSMPRMRCRVIFRRQSFARKLHTRTRSLCPTPILALFQPPCTVSHPTPLPAISLLPDMSDQT